MRKSPTASGLPWFSGSVRAAEEGILLDGAQGAGSVQPQHKAQRPADHRTPGDIAFFALLLGASFLAYWMALAIALPLAWQPAARAAMVNAASLALVAIPTHLLLREKVL